MWRGEKEGKNRGREGDTHRDRNREREITHMQFYHILPTPSFKQEKWGSKCRAGATETNNNVSQCLKHGLTGLAQLEGQITVICRQKAVCVPSGCTGPLQLFRARTFFFQLPEQRQQISAPDPPLCNVSVRLGLWRATDYSREENSDNLKQLSNRKEAVQIPSSCDLNIHSY